MFQKIYTRFHMDFDSSWTKSFGVFMGLSFFLRIVYYFGLKSFRDVGIIELLTFGIAGIALCGCVVVWLICMQKNAPGLYGIIGVIHCLLIIILTCFGGNLVRIILALVWYFLAANILLLTVSGRFPGRLFAALMFFAPVAVRFIVFDLGRIGLITWVQELAVLSTLLALGCFAMGLKGKATEK